MNNKIVPITSGVWRQHIPQTDLEVNFNLSGRDLVVRVNKGGVQVFRVLLRDAAADLTEKQLMQFNPLSPDLIVKVGDVEEGIRRMVRNAGLDLG
jgi:hypothetical protein